MNIILLILLSVSIIFITLGYLENTKTEVVKTETKLIKENIYDNQFKEEYNKYKHLFDDGNIWLSYPFNSNNGYDFNKIATERLNKDEPLFNKSRVKKNIDNFNIMKNLLNIYDVEQLTGYYDINFNSEEENCIDEESCINEEYYTEEEE